MTGIEVTLAIAAFPAASVQTVTYIVNFSKLLHEKIIQYNKADAITADFRKYSRDLYEGELKGFLTVAQALFQPGSSPLPHLKQSVSADLNALGVLLIKANRLLDENLDENGKAKKVKMALGGGAKDIRNCAQDLENLRAKFQTTVQSADKQREAEQKVNHLTNAIFTTESAPSHTIFLDPCSRATLLQGKLLSHQGTEVFLALVEKKVYPEDGDGSGLADVTSQLAAALHEPGQGILRCVGWRKHSTGHFELIFEIPKRFRDGETLWIRMLRDGDKGYAGDHCLAARLTLARQLSGAVAFTHKKFLVHKNIRSDSILLLRAPDEDGLGHLSLISWSMVRQLRGLTVTDSGEEWEHDMYRHPKRQMPQAPDENHHFGHDIYSLGVTLLEIGMWEPLIVPVREGSRDLKVSDSFREEAKESDFQPTEGPGRVLEPDEVQGVLISLAQRFLPIRMGPRFTNVVVSCLKCVEEGFSGNTDFLAMEHNPTEQYVVKELAKIIV